MTIFMPSLRSFPPPKSTVYLILWETCLMKYEIRGFGRWPTGCREFPFCTHHQQVLFWSLKTNLNYPGSVLPSHDLPSESNSVISLLSKLISTSEIDSKPQKKGDYCIVGRSPLTTSDNFPEVAASCCHWKGTTTFFTGDLPQPPPPRPPVQSRSLALWCPTAGAGRSSTDPNHTPTSPFVLFLLSLQTWP